MGDKSVPAITIRVYPATLAGFALLGAILVGSIGLWTIQAPWLLKGSGGDRLDHASGFDLKSSTFEEENDPPIPRDQPPQVDEGVWPAQVTEPLVPVQATTLEEPEVASETGNVAKLTYPGQALGIMRVGNQTPYPVRIALLQRHGITDKSDQASIPGTIVPLSNDPSQSPLNITEPVHWDFEPEEGAYQGLILSLGQGDLKLQPGDVLVAFAQDGSRRYWGPYVAGETSLPYWNVERSEWQLLLQP